MTPPLRKGLLGLALLAATALALQCHRAPKPAPEAKSHGVRRLTDLPYGPSTEPVNESHLLDVYLPVNASSFPMLLFLHGGSWQGGNKKSYRDLAQRFVREGVAVAVMNYRLSPQVQHPAHIQDVARAVAWLHEKMAEWGADPKNLFVFGHSAGGHLAALLATDDTFLKAEKCDLAVVAGVIPISGEYYIKAGQWPGVFGVDEETARAASPATYVKPGLPPFLILYAGEESPRVQQDSQAFAKRLTEEKNKARSLEIPDRGHASLIHHLADPNDPAGRVILEFIHQNRRSD